MAGKVTNGIEPFVRYQLCSDGIDALQDHPKFSNVAGEQPLLFSRALQMSEEKQPQAMRLGDAVSQRIIANETLAYFIGRTYLFLKRVGIDSKRLRFRQHLFPDENKALYKFFNILVSLTVYEHSNSLN